MVLLLVVLPLCAHRQAVLTNRNGYIQGGTQGHANRLHGVVQGSVFIGFATSGHPIGREFDFFEIYGCSQCIENRFSHSHATACRRIK